MDKGMALDGLTDKDHQKSLAIINWLNNCQTRDDFNQVLKVALLPLIGCNGVFYARHVDGQSKPQLLDSINQSTCCPYSWKQFLNFTVQNSALTPPSGSTLTTNTNIGALCNGALNHRHDSFDYSWQRMHRHVAILTLLDDHDGAYRFYFCRLNARQHAYSQRETALLTILRQSLLQTIKLVLFREESRRSRQIIDFCSEHTEPVAVIRDDGEMLFQSRAFVQVAAQDKETFLPAALSLVKMIQHKKHQWCRFLSRLGQRLYEIKLTLISSAPNPKQYVYFLHLSRVTHTIGKIFNQLNRKGLTHRELEIALLIYQGIQTREIAETIHLSYHTVRNHIKSIYSKLGISSRGEMLVWVG